VLRPELDQVPVDGVDGGGVQSRDLAQHPSQCALDWRAPQTAEELGPSPELRVLDHLHAISFFPNGSISISL
jgi:hypothetical protein